MLIHLQATHKMANSPVQHQHANPSAFSGLDRLGFWMMRRPAAFLILVLVSVLLLPVAVWLDLKNLSNASLRRQATDLNYLISDIRSYYSSNVVGRILGNHGNATPSHNYEDVAGGIPIPATLSIELGNVIGSRSEDISYRFISDEPFKVRASHNLDTFEINALKELRASGKTDASVQEVDGSIFDRRIRMAVPVILGAACVACHNSHPESPRNDWKVGDVRGMQSITIRQPIAANILSFQYLLGYLVVAVFFGLAFAYIQWRQARSFSHLNMELEETNSFLAAISMKISKYLSPQIYKSIFSGEKDAVIATERKKLTIFFSDIKDFTTTTERLQPEELTMLLNEYFTEMSKIAHEHGATVDKFIGDAILAFFGDPETRGAKEDALICVQMAIAMQKRLHELGKQWRRRGIEKPLMARMGINTGYCNVGNFGSADRMDYTIIGAEANLAARLESIAEPGGIVLSYETYALVEDKIEGTPLKPIKLKGISRQVIPYKVTNILDPNAVAADQIVELNAEQFRLHLNLDGMKKRDREKAKNALSSALQALDNLDQVS